VDGQHFEIGQNLFAFLFRFRKMQENCDQSQRNRLAWLWIDQLSIDQQNSEEKTHQVRLMGDIYRGSKLTISWLGFKYSGSLKRHEYFSRVWIIQELVLSRKILLLFGLEDSVTWEEFIRGDLVEDERGELGPFSMSYNTGPIQRIRKELAESIRNLDGEPGLHLCDILSYLTSLRSGDPKDQIYGLLGLVKTSERPVIDYRKTVQQVFLDAAAIVLNSPAPKLDFYPKSHLLSEIGASMELIYDHMTIDPPEHGNSYPGKFLSQFIAHLEELIDRLSALPIQHQRERISKLGFRRFTKTYCPLPRWAVDRDWKNCPGKWWFEYCGQKYCFAKYWYALRRAPNGVLGGSLGYRKEDVIFYLPPM